MDNNNKGVVLYENGLYEVVVGDSQMMDDMKVYLAINKSTAVIEAEDQMFPRIVDYANQLDMKTKELIEEGVLDEPPPPVAEVTH